MEKKTAGKLILALGCALLAAVLYAVNIPFSKLLLTHVGSFMMAGFLYLGAGIGMGFIYPFSKRNENTEKIGKKDIVYVLGMIVLDVAAPVLLMKGLSMEDSSSASLLNNFEIVATTLFAFLFFHEKGTWKLWIGVFFVTLSSFFLSFEDLSSFRFSYGALFVLLATICWGLENNCTRMLSGKNTSLIVLIKGLCSGSCSLLLGFFIKESFPELIYVLEALALGFGSYGLSIFFYIRAQKNLGAARTSAFYSVNPFIGSLLSFLLLKESLETMYFIGLGIMALGTVVLMIDTLSLKKDEK